MGRPSFATTFSAPFENNGGEDNFLYSSAVCPYCKHINTISYNTDDGSLDVEKSCEHLTHYESPTGHRCDFQFTSGGE